MTARERVLRRRTITGVDLVEGQCGMHNSTCYFAVEFGAVASSSRRRRTQPHRRASAGLRYEPLQVRIDGRAPVGAHLRQGPGALGGDADQHGAHPRGRRCVTPGRRPRADGPAWSWSAARSGRGRPNQRSAPRPDPRSWTVGGPGRTAAESGHAGWPVGSAGRPRPADRPRVQVVAA